MATKINGVNKLSCLITIGEYNEQSDYYMDSKYVFNECVNIEINDSYETLTNTAKITLTRDVRLKLTQKNEDGYISNKVLTNEDFKSMFKKSDRVRIHLGYDDDNKLMFDGFIITVDAKSPFTLYCEDWGYILKNRVVNPSEITVSKYGTHINPLLNKILDGSAISLHPLSEKMDLIMPIKKLKDPLSLSALLEYWKTYLGVLIFIKMVKNKPCLAISRTYFSENKDETLIVGNVDSVDVIEFDENVPIKGDKLKFTYLDYDTLALEATSINAKYQRTRFTLILNPKFFGQDIAQGIVSDEFLVKNITTTSKKQNKLNNATVENRFDLTHHNIRTFHEYNVSYETLLKDAKSAFKKISQTGISGSLTVFGDFGLKAASMVRLNSKRNPERNGVYVISDVKTKFGTAGYRQTIQIPFKRSN